MSSRFSVKHFRMIYNRSANTHVPRTVTTMALAAGVLKIVAPQPGAIYPIHLLLAIVVLTITTTIYLALCRKTVYLVDYACFRPSFNLRCPKATFLEHAHLSSLLDDSTVNFIGTVLKRSEMSDETYVPPVLHYIEPYCGLYDARAEAESIVFSVTDDLLAKTCINRDAIGVLITTSSIFCPIPSIADMIVNRYKLRGDLCVMNLSGMACSASMTAVGLASNMLQVMPWGSHALIVSTETTGPGHYQGNTRSMQLPNILFRIGGVAKLLSTSRSKARFQLAHVTRIITAANNSAYRCAYQEEDEKGILGTRLTKDLMVVAGDALKDNLTASGPLVLPTAELLKFFFFDIVGKVLYWRKIRPYIPNFCVAFEHICIHVGGPAVISSIQRGLNLSDKHVEPSRMTLYRFGNQSAASVWYELAYIDAKGLMKKGDRVWMIGFGAGYECNTATWVCIQPSSCADGPWVDCINCYPVDISRKG
ncbi:3-ketoacyl-CoA synthase 6-like [Triticum urartu]|nr:3-ketoacyl-CoA synthase 6-like [Triticum urartu]